ncbi:phosphate ABC transporter permease PstA [Motilibacter deserti]|uniref:Phosphate transport system permease protein PstA n=1 Tax=Motilibacter deserti TaxID=2714956 RepID=A0ABX0GVA2_9ACTN|nr:phosphate ABC transporter permease PstA [Motilibacter deserti]NHC14854.1 phosphate ABC transporter permease PstA [Motilibacter deserti]
MTTSTFSGTAPAAAAPAAVVERPVETKRSLRSVRRSDVLALVGAAVGAVSCTSLLFFRLAPFSGKLGFVVVAYLLFLGFYALLVSRDEAGPVVRDRLAAAVSHSLAFVLLLAMVVVIGYTLWRGKDAWSHANFFTEDMRRTGPLDPLDVGGIAHAAVGTLEQIALALVVTVPLGLTCAVFLLEARGRLARLVRMLTEAMTALPSIVAGLFVYAMLIVSHVVERSGLAASIAISVMMLPIVIRAADVVLRLVPGNLKEASLALGASRWRTVWHVVLPTARSGLTTAVILGTARGIGETSPVLLTAGYATAMNANPLQDPMTSLPLATFQLVKSSQPEMIARGFGAAATLLAIVLVLFVVARVIGGKPPGQLSKRAQKRAARASERDARRFTIEAVHQLVSEDTNRRSA